MLQTNSQIFSCWFVPLFRFGHLEAMHYIATVALAKPNAIPESAVHVLIIFTKIRNIDWNYKEDVLYSSIVNPHSISKVAVMIVTVNKMSIIGIKTSSSHAHKTLTSELFLTIFSANETEFAMKISKFSIFEKQILSRGFVKKNSTTCFCHWLWLLRLVHALSCLQQGRSKPKYVTLTSWFECSHPKFSLLPCQLVAMEVNLKGGSNSDKTLNI